MKEKGKGEEQRDEVTSVKDLATAFATISIFMASLSATFLQYAQGSFNARPAGTPDKQPDHVVEAFPLISISLSLGSTCILGFASVAASNFLRKSSGFTPLLVATGKVVRHWHVSTRYNNTLAETADGRGSEYDHQQSTIHAEDYVIRSRELVDLSIFPLTYSATTFLVGLSVFVWAEQSRSVSISLTVALFMVLALVSITDFPTSNPDGRSRQKDTGSKQEVGNREEDGREKPGING
ncbi:uncharacterized protein FOMMEDRAFT_161086 [Fomitiporia mediterranea MF3/22]|uniref:uncharacterized protein n=1 Tax=Fomitiporia mediterranea (strain MF3/22) TaxID=694068 RepID=UPI0004408464|nr:uncharacterized protein FOMMEDRAFT_161086 [Fomitiporia mediterranea MF3/22]EJC98904.1 hypothetical protein FOMMEDRAFT_161086 [Fomitiporia mediterranea MF3/22]